jgi:uncharacterized membrane protein
VSYTVFKWLHVVGVIMIVGNVTVTAVWKVFADRTGDARIIAFGQRLVTITDWSMTLGGIVLLLVGGFGATVVAGVHPFGQRWLIWGEALFGLSGAMWLGILVPTQIRQARMARDFASDGEVPQAYKRDARRWIIWGIIATIPLLVAVWVMTAKPV